MALDDDVRRSGNAQGGRTPPQDSGVVKEHHPCPHCLIRDRHSRKLDLVVNYRKVADGYEWKADCRECNSSTVNRKHFPDAKQAGQGMVVSADGEILKLYSAIAGSLEEYLIYDNDLIRQCMVPDYWPAKGGAS